MTAIYPGPVGLHARLILKAAHRMRIRPDQVADHFTHGSANGIPPGMLISTVGGAGSTRSNVSGKSHGGVDRLLTDTGGTDAMYHYGAGLASQWDEAWPFFCEMKFYYDSNGANNAGMVAAIGFSAGGVTNYFALLGLIGSGSATKFGVGKHDGVDLEFVDGIDFDGAWHKGCMYRNSDGLFAEFDDEAPIVCGVSNLPTIADEGIAIRGVANGGSTEVKNLFADYSYWAGKAITP